MKSSKRRMARVLGLGVACALVWGAAMPAAATPATLKRSIENMTQWPLDIAAAPIVSGTSIANNMANVQDSPGVRIAYPVPGYAWNLMVNWGASVLRGVSGVLEFLPGVVLVFTDAEMRPIFDPPIQNQALVDQETPIYHIKFGVDYTTPSY